MPKAGFLAAFVVTVGILSCHGLLKNFIVFVAGVFFFFSVKRRQIKLSTILNKTKIKKSTTRRAENKQREST